MNNVDCLLLVPGHFRYAQRILRSATAVQAREARAGPLLRPKRHMTDRILARFYGYPHFLKSYSDPGMPGKRRDNSQPLVPYQQ